MCVLFIYSFLGFFLGSGLYEVVLSMTEEIREDYLGWQEARTQDYLMKEIN